MIDINELRRLALDGDLAAMQEIIHRLEAAEKERDALRADKATLQQMMYSLKDRLEAAEKENAKLREALVEKVVSETMLRDLSIRGGSIHASFEGGAMHLLVDAFVEQFVESGATNYLEMQFHSNVTGPLVVTLQRVNGKTAHQLRAEAEKERDALRAELDALKGWEPFREKDDRFREAFEKTLKERGWNTDRVGPGYRSGMAQHAWFIALGTVDKLKLYLSPVPASVPDDVMRERVVEAVAEALGDGAYDCTRVWSAWGYGTMGSDDFRLIADDHARLDEIAEAAIQAVFAAAPKPEGK